MLGGRWGGGDVTRVVLAWVCEVVGMDGYFEDVVVGEEHAFGSYEVGEDE